MKRYCSGECYKASKYYASQLSTVPIWSRNNLNEDDNSGFINKDKDESKAVVIGSSNGSTLISKSNLYSTEIERELNMIEQEWKTKMLLVEKNVNNNPEKKKNALIKPVVVEKTLNPDNDEAETKNSIIKSESNKILMEVFRNDVSEYLLTKIFNCQTNILDRFKDKTQLMEYLVRRLEDLMTQDAKDYIKNEKSVFENVKSERERLEFNQRYLSYRSKFEIDNNLDSDDDPDSDLSKKNEELKKPLPFYEKLKEEAMLQQLKIIEFFRPSKLNEQSDVEDDDLIILPEIDSISQKQIRQKIFFEKLVKNFESLLKYSNFEYNAELKNHMKNFISVLK